MNELEQKAGPSPRRQLNLFYLIDTSSSMAGNKIASVNAVMPDVIKIIEEVDEANKDNAKILVSCLEFSTGCRWSTNVPVECSSFVWRDLQADGLTDLGAAFKELYSKMRRSQYLQSETGHFAPIVILLSDGEPTDDYKAGLRELQGNMWFNAAIKVAIAIGDDANKEVLKEFVKNKELVITVHDTQSLKEIIKVVTRGVSQIGSQSTTNDKDKKELVAEMVNEVVSQVDHAENVNSPITAPDKWD